MTLKNIRKYNIKYNWCSKQTFFYFLAKLHGRVNVSKLLLDSVCGYQRVSDGKNKVLYKLKHHTDI